MDNSTPKQKYNPFPGLRPFGIDESHLFFGREGQSETIVEYIKKFKFACVTGASGSGKSSLIYCGVIPLLFGGFIPEAGSNWKIIASRPGNTPIWNLAESLSKSEKSSSEEDENKTEYYYSLLKRHSLGLHESIKQLNLQKDENLLLVVDQFEEIFRYKNSSETKNSHRDEPGLFIDLLVNAVNKSDLPIYIIVTMRSDFIGDCSEFQEFTALINKSNYLVPRMDRSDIEQVILGPVRVANAEIDKKLLQHLLNNIDEIQDQLPVLQHAMMRTWEFWAKYNQGTTPIGMRDYMAAGKIENALSLHANEAFNQLDDNQRDICKNLFKALTQKGADGKGIRRPITIREISEVTQAQPTEIIKIANLFRQKDRCFLAPSIEKKLEYDSVLDISHESLMRVWDKLKVWVDEEAASAQTYLRLVELAEQYQIGRTGLLRPPELHLASNWKKTEKPNRIWAKRYHPAFEKAMVFLSTSEKKFKSEEEIKIKVQRRALNRTRRIAVFMSFVAAAFLGLMFYTYQLSREAIRQKELAEGYAEILEMQKDTAVEFSQLKQYEALKALHEKDSLEKASLLQIIQKEEETEEAYEIIDRVTQRSAELQKTAEQIEREKIKAEEEAQEALRGLSQAEVEKLTEVKKRMIVLSHSLAIKAGTQTDRQLGGLLAYHAYLINRENGGQINHPDIYRGLYLSLRELKGEKYNTMTGHTDQINAIIFDPARNILYSADEAGYIKRWAFRRQNSVPSNIIANDEANTCLDISVDGRWLACGSAVNKVQLFNALQPTQAPRVFEAHNGMVTHVKLISGRNAMITAGNDKTLKYWDLLSNSSRTIYSNDADVTDISVSPQGDLVVFTTSNGKLLQWNISTNRTQEIYRQSNPLTSVTFDFDAETLAVGDNTGELKIIQARTGRLLTTIKAHNSRILDIEFSPDNRQLATSAMDAVIRIWNSTDWNDLPIEIRESESWAVSLAFSPDGRNLLTSSNNENSIFIWPIKAELLAEEMCSYITRQLTRQEWEANIGNDVEYREVCND